MSEHTAVVAWRREGAPFTDLKYSRAHSWAFDGGLEVRASSSPHSVRPPMSDPAAVDPEEAFVAALSSCHMLWFLSIAAKRGFVVDSYEDRAVGVLSRDPAGKMAITSVTLRPVVIFAGEKRPGDDELDTMHHEAHEECYIASSVVTDVRVSR
ncbi:MAG TPA: OsmC family protein [Kofleriaceae bacterium]|nr:OsmC family protein [Kofleriaceae bacterium]